MTNLSHKDCVLDPLKLDSKSKRPHSHSKQLITDPRLSLFTTENPLGSYSFTTANPLIQTQRARRAFKMKHSIIKRPFTVTLFNTKLCRPLKKAYSSQCNEKNDIAYKIRITCLQQPITVLIDLMYRIARNCHNCGSLL